MLGLEMQQALQQRVVIGGLEPRRAPPVAHVGVERSRPDDKAEGVDLSQVHSHLLPAASLLVVACCCGGGAVGRALLDVRRTDE